MKRRVWLLLAREARELRERWPGRSIEHALGEGRDDLDIAAARAAFETRTASTHAPAFGVFGA